MTEKFPPFDHAAECKAFSFSVSDDFNFAFDIVANRAAEAEATGHSSHYSPRTAAAVDPLARTAAASVDPPFYILQLFNLPVHDFMPVHAST